MCWNLFIFFLFFFIGWWWLFDHSVAAVLRIFLVPSLARHPVSAPRPCETKWMGREGGGREVRWWVGGDSTGPDDNMEMGIVFFLFFFFSKNLDLVFICLFFLLFIIPDSEFRALAGFVFVCFVFPAPPGKGRSTVGTWSARPPIRTRLNTLLVCLCVCENNRCVLCDCQSSQPGSVSRVKKKIKREEKNLRSSYFFIIFFLLCCS
jgi:hypothetical protein